MHFEIENSNCFRIFRAKKQIKTAILENEFLGNLEEVQVEALVSAMYPKNIPPSTLVIQEGDIGETQPTK